MSQNSEDFKHNAIGADFLIIGSGLAGLYAANYASKFGEVIIATKSTLIESNSYWAQGGIAAALDPEDSTKFHKDDTVSAGRGLCKTEAVDVLVKEGKERVLDLIELGMEFDSDEEGLLFGLEGGHSKRRVLHAGGNSTGENIVEFLISSVSKNLKIKILELTTITDLISEGTDCFGAWGYNQDKSEYILITAGTTIMATGGASALFKRTTNPEGSTGEGIDLAYRAGAELMDMEFIQFHPTAFYTEDGETFLITEAVRGEGAHLVNIEGKRFMKNYHNLGELAPRDIVSKAIHNEIKESGYNYVYLALSHLERSFIIKRFANIYGLCLRNGFDLTCDLIPVSPAAHYTIGGVRTGLNGETNLRGFFACGEVACTGVHGANRLASNSLLECIVFAKRAVDESLKDKAEPDSTLKPGTPSLVTGTSNDEGERFKILKNRIEEENNKNLGIVREKESLESHIRGLEEIVSEGKNLSGWFKYKVSSMANVSILIARFAIIREESRGAHIRADFPDERDDLEVHFLIKRGTGPYKVGV